MSQENFDHAKVNIALQQAIAAILGDRPIAYHAVLARALNSVTAGVFLSQLLYWTPRSQDQAGWVWKTRTQIYEETALSRTEQETARKVLKRAKVLEEKLRGVPATMHFRINMEKLIELLSQAHQNNGGENGEASRESRRSRGKSSQLAGNLPTGWQENAQLVGGNATNQLAGNLPTINTETTSKTTAENTTENLDSNLGRSNGSSRTSSGRRSRQGRPTPTSPLTASAASANISLGSSEHSNQNEQLSLSEPGATVEVSHSSPILSSVGQLLARRAATLKIAPQRRSGPHRAAEKTAADLEDLNPDSGPERAQDSPRGKKTGFVSTPYLDQVVKEFSEIDLRDAESVKSNQRQARNLMLQVGMDEEKFVQNYIYLARSQTRAQVGVERRGAYFFACLRDLLGMREDEAGPLPPMHQPLDETGRSARQDHPR